jgi:ATP-dependent Clp protease ATP-binding subunit ClpX
MPSCEFPVATIISLSDFPQFSATVLQMIHGELPTMLVCIRPDLAPWSVHYDNGQWKAETQLPIRASIERAAIQLMLLDRCSEHRLNAKIDHTQWHVRVAAQAVGVMDSAALAVWLKDLTQTVATAEEIDDRPVIPLGLTAQARELHQHEIRRVLAITPDPDAMLGRAVPSEILRWLPNAGCKESVIIEICERYGTGQVTPKVHEELLEALKVAVSVKSMELCFMEGQAHALVRKLVSEHHRSLGWMDHEGFIRSSRFHVRLSLSRFQMPWMEADPTDPLWPPERRHLIARLGWMLVGLSWGDEWYVERYLSLLESNTTWETLEGELNQLRKHVAEFHREVPRIFEAMQEGLVASCWQHACTRFARWSESKREVLWTWVRDLTGQMPSSEGIQRIPGEERCWGQVFCHAMTCEVWQLAARDNPVNEDLVLSRESLLRTSSSMRAQAKRRQMAEAKRFAEDPRDLDVDTEFVDPDESKEDRELRRWVRTLESRLQSENPQSALDSNAVSVHPALRLADALEEDVMGQSEACRAMAFALHAHRLGNSRGAVLLHGPTGSGKSHLITVAARLADDLPVAHVSAPAIVPEGIRGLNMSGILLQLFRSAGHDIKRAESGILVFDEFDKVVSAKGHHEYCAAMQVALLRIIDGCEWGFGSHEDHLPIKSISTRKMLIVLAGAWQHCYAHQESLGFTTKAGHPTPENLDLIDDLGLAPELAGRVSEVAAINPHSAESLLAILNKAKGSPWEAVKSLAQVDIRIELSASETLVAYALDRNLGARYLTTATRSMAKALTFLSPGERPACIDGHWVRSQLQMGR